MITRLFMLLSRINLVLWCSAGILIIGSMAFEFAFINLYVGLFVLMVGGLFGIRANRWRKFIERNDINAQQDKPLLKVLQVELLFIILISFVILLVNAGICYRIFGEKTSVFD